MRFKGESNSGSFVTVIDNLNSTSATDALSAKQGKVLNDLKADKTLRITEIPADGNYNPNVLYVLTLDNTERAINLNAAAAGLAAEYHLLLTIGAARPTIRWPDGLKYDYGTGVTITAPTIDANHVYEINIVENKAYVKDWGESQ